MASARIWSQVEIQQKYSLYKDILLNQKEKF